MKIILFLITLSTLLLANIGEVTALSGSAKLQRLSKIITVAQGTKIEQKDHITTASHSRVQVILKDDTVVTIGPQSEYSFDTYKDESDVEVLMKIQRGFFKTVTGKIGKIAPQKFKIRTRAATIGIRGTQFMAYVTEDEEHIGCIQGKIIVWTKEGEFMVMAGKMIVYRNKHWTLQEIEMEEFSPVMIGMLLQHQKLSSNTFKTPSSRSRKSYLLEEQASQEAAHKAEVEGTKKEPFTVTMRDPITNEIPSFLYDDEILDPSTNYINPFTLTSTPYIQAYLLQEELLNAQTPSTEPFTMDAKVTQGIPSFLYDDEILDPSTNYINPFTLTSTPYIQAYLLQEQLLNAQTPSTEPFNFNSDSTQQIPEYLLQENILDPSGSVTEPFNLTLNDQLINEQTPYLFEEQTLSNAPDLIEPFSFGVSNQLLDEQTSYLLEEQIIDISTAIEPFSFDLGSEISNTTPSFLP